MPTSITFAGRKVTLPGVYATVISGITSPSAPTNYAGVCFIDTGWGQGHLGGSAISGTNLSGVDTMYSFTSLEALRNFARHGRLWYAAQNLFFPMGKQSGISGANPVYVVRASETTPGSLTVEFDAGDVTIVSKEEGLIVNGVLTGGVLTKGYALKLLADPLNSGKFLVQLWRGCFRGYDTYNVAYDPFTYEPELLAQSPSTAQLSEVITWMQTDLSFSTLFETTTPSATGTIISGDITGNTGYLVVTGATETYTTAAYQKVLDNLSYVDANWFMQPDSASALAAKNLQLHTWLEERARYKAFMVFAGGADATAAFGNGSSSNIAQTLNSEKAIVVHGNVKQANKLGLRKIDTWQNAALLLGRLAGLRPGVSSTLKKYNVQGLVHQPTENERERLLEAGVVTIVRDPELDFVIEQGVNTLQANDYFINLDGKSSSIQVERDKGYLEKDLAVTFKKTFFGREEGVTRFSPTAEDTVEWFKVQLQKKAEEGLVLDFRNIVAEYQNDNLFVSFEFILNTEINKVFISGILLDKFD